MISFPVFKKELALRRTQLAPLHREMEHDDNFIHAAAVWGDRSMMQYFFGLDDKAKIRMLSIADDIITTGLSQYVIGEHPSVQVVLPRASHPDTPQGRKNREDHARRLQDALDALLWQMDTYAREKPLRTVGYHQLGLGMGVMGYPILWDRFPKHPFKSRYGDVPYRKPEASWNARDRKAVSDFNRRRQEAIPWDTHAVHPRRVFFDLESDPPEDVIIETNVLPGMYMRRYPNLRLENRGETAKYLIYCSKEEYGLWLNDQPLLTSADGANAEGFAKNRTGILWYRMAYGGFGNQSFGNEWHYQIQGIIRGIRSEIVTKTIDYNVMGVMRQVYGIPPLGVEAPTIAEATIAAQRIVFGMGAAWPHTPEERQHALELPRIPEVIFQELNESDTLIERHTWSDVMKGANPASETAAGAGQRLSQGQASLQPEKTSIDHLLSGMLEDICHMVKHELQEPVELLSRDMGLVRIDPDDWVEGARILVNSKPATAEQKMAERRESIALIDARLRSRYTTLVGDPDVLDPEEEMARILADAAMESEGVIGMIAQAALQGVTGGQPSGMSPEAAMPEQSPLARGQNGAQPLVAPSEVGQPVGLPPLRRE